MKKHRVALYTALILDSNGCSRVVPVLVIARPLHTARVHRNVSAVDDSVAAARGSYASRLPSSGGVTLYFGIPKRPLLVNSLFFSSHLILTLCRLIPQEFQAIVHIYLNFYLYRHNRRNSTSAPICFISMFCTILHVAKILCSFASLNVT